MGMNQAMLMEMKHEAASTRKMLERVPLDKADWKPHDKSMMIGRLATHVAEIPNWTLRALNADEFDMAKTEFKRHIAADTAELLAIHDKSTTEAIAALENASDEELMKPWTFRQGEQVFFTLPKAAVIRNMAMNHLYHHRGQLSVFLRLNDVAIPGMYGPSADERM